MNNCQIVVNRLKSYISLHDVCNYIGIHVSTLATLGRMDNPIKGSNIWKPENERDLYYHLSKIKYFIENGIEDPIDIDCLSNNGKILSFPIIIDGRHRYIAALLLHSLIIPAIFSGNNDLLDYLTGQTKRRP